MQRNFVRQVGPKLINEDPGHPAEVYARRALERGLSESNSQGPVFSLASSLARTVREQRLPSIRRAQVDGVYCYFPAETTADTPDRDVSRSDNSGRTDERVRRGHDTTIIPIGVGDEVLHAVDLLVEIGQYQSRADAILWIADEWLAQNQVFIHRLVAAVERVRELRASLKVTGRPSP